jgi:hypothetical protein
LFADTALGDAIPATFDLASCAATIAGHVVVVVALLGRFNGAVPAFGF